MAGDWIKMRMDLPEDPTVFVLCEKTKLDRHGLVGRLYAFWSWVDKFAVDGRVDGATSTAIDTVVQHPGFAEALVAVKWLSICDGYIKIPNYERHNGESAKERSLKNNRQARWRAKNPVDGDVDDGPSTRPSTRASTREEKRRSSKPSRATNGAFTQFWEVYPRKKSKGAAEKAWAKIQPDEQLTERILAAVKRATTSTDWRRDAGQFIPHPATWLNAKGWEDELRPTEDPNRPRW